MSNLTQSSPSRQSPSGAPSTRPPAASGNGNPMLDMRRKRAVTLVPTVRRVEGGFRVSSSSRNISYLITQPNGHLMCTCLDYQRRDEEPHFKCKHIWAVEMALEEDRLPAAGNGHPTSAAVVEGASSLSVLHRYLPGEERVRLKLIKNTKGYSWEISVAEVNPEAALSVLQDLEQRVKAVFGGNGNEE